MKTYLALQVSRPGILEAVRREIPQVPAGHALLRVEACGICGADAGTVEATAPGLVLPRVPGHEVVGRIVAVGPGTQIWRVGQRVGVGRLGGNCGVCAACRNGEFVLCSDQPVVGLSVDGGYAEMLLVRASALVAIPEGLDAVAAAPLLCAGLATFNALRKSGAGAGDTVAVLGMGGLGHLALQYARKMGYRVIALARGSAKRTAALALGAHAYIDTAAEDPAKALQALGGAQLILATITEGGTVAAAFAGLAPRGKLLVLGAGREPVAIPPGRLIAGERVIAGSMTGTTIESERTLGFSLLADVRAQVEVLPLAEAAAAYRRMRAGEARFRMVLTVGGA